MKEETELGIAPVDWSTPSQMNDPRPNGKPLFDARFHGTPLGRARAGRSMTWDPRGTANAGGTRRFENVDITAVMAKKNSAQVKRGTESAQFAEYYDGVRLNGTNEDALALAQMSQLQRSQIDKDGDGKVSADELKADGMTKVGGQPWWARK